MTKLTEATIGLHLARAIDHIDEGRLIANDTIGYARTGAGDEVDILPVPVTGPAGPARTVPLEGKWVDSRWRGDARTIEGKYGQGILRHQIDPQHRPPHLGYPAPILALLLQEACGRDVETYVLQLLRNRCGAPCAYLRIRSLTSGPHDSRHQD